jgi:hypothetical protein
VMTKRTESSNQYSLAKLMFRLQRVKLKENKETEGKMLVLRPRSGITTIESIDWVTKVNGGQRNAGVGRNKIWKVKKSS